MTTKLAIYNGSLRILGERKTTLTEDRPARRYLDDAWDDGLIDWVLEEGYWSFATRSIKATADSSVTPEFGYRYAFAKPDDYIKLAALCSDEYFTNTVHQYHDEGDYWYCDFDTLYIQYISNHADFGADLSRWPESAADLAKARLADQIKELVTGNDMKTQSVKYALKQAKTNARSKDLMNKPTRFAPSGSWVSARMRGVTNTDGNRS